MRHTRPLSLALLTLIAVSLVGCDPEARALKPDERDRLTAALSPLMRAAWGADVARCRLFADVLDSDDFFAVMAAGSDGPCDLAVRVTAAAVNTLTPGALQTLLAHELGHVRSKHSTGMARATEIRGARTDGGQQSRLQIAGQQFTPVEETEADQAAAGLMTTVWRGGNVGCLATADLYENIAPDRKRWGVWLSRHPFPERRVDAVVQACAAEQRRAPR
jgi:hypothetical protein